MHLIHEFVTKGIWEGEAWTGELGCEASPLITSLQAEFPLVIMIPETKFVHSMEVQNTAGENLIQGDHLVNRGEDQPQLLPKTETKSSWSVMFHAEDLDKYLSLINTINHVNIDQVHVIRRSFKALPPAPGDPVHELRLDWKCKEPPTWTAKAGVWRPQYSDETLVSSWLHNLHIKTEKFNG
jgi:hypothetical protein